MKVKQRPEDFIVRELSDVTPSSGPFALYQLHKIGWTTPDALAVIRRHLKVPPQRISYGGLKDRHADTTQFITIYRGSPHNWEHRRLWLTYLGQVPEPFTPGHIRANQFELCIRGLTDSQEQAAMARMPELQTLGVPNYFDDQRFGSVGSDQRFIARELVLGRWEEALRLALAAEYDHDRAEQKAIKASLRQHWNDWPACKAALPRGSERSIVDYLVHHPTDYKGAFARLKPEITSLYLAAYQSHLWNAMLAEWLRQRVDTGQLVQIPLKLGLFPAPIALRNQDLHEWERGSLPLPSARIKAQAEAGWYDALCPVLQREGLTLDELRIRGLPKPYFSKGERAMCLRPAELQASSADDELNARQRRMNIRFTLPRGAYATMIIKRLFQVRLTAS